MKSMPNGAERQVLIDRMAGIVRRDAPWIGNCKPKLMSNNTLKHRSLDADLRERKTGERNRPDFAPFALLVPFTLLAAITALLVLPAALIVRRRRETAL